MNQSNKYRPPKEVFIREEDVQLPVHLDETTIAAHLQTVSRTAPEQLPGTVRAIRKKWAYTMGGWVERGRLAYVETVLRELRISHEILTECLEMERELTRHRFEQKEGLPALEAQAQAEEIRVRIENAKAQQAEARRRRQDCEEPPPVKRELTAEEKRKENLRRAEEKIARLKTRMDKHLAELLRSRTFEQLPLEEQEEFRADENMYRDRIRRAKDELIEQE